ncbi:MAG: hypothetical protein KTR32_30405 [Granulosicoccus sp.]|nr:hypothetical protein [Granulosicoccus sp.]
MGFLKITRTASPANLDIQTDVRLLLKGTYACVKYSMSSRARQLVHAMHDIRFFIVYLLADHRKSNVLLTIKRTKACYNAHEMIAIYCMVCERHVKQLALSNDPFDNARAA